jgi:hypothetical protein
MILTQLNEKNILCSNGIKIVGLEIKNMFFEIYP